MSRSSLDSGSQEEGLYVMEGGEGGREGREGGREGGMEGGKEVRK